MGPVAKITSCKISKPGRLGLTEAFVVALVFSAHTSSLQAVAGPSSVGPSPGHGKGVEQLSQPRLHHNHRRINKIRREILGTRPPAAFHFPMNHPKHTKEDHPLSLVSRTTSGQPGRRVQNNENVNYNINVFRARVGGSGGGDGGGAGDGGGGRGRGRDHGHGRGRGRGGGVATKKKSSDQTIAHQRLDETNVGQGLNAQDLEMKLHLGVIFRRNIIAVFGHILNLPDNPLTNDQYASLYQIQQALILKRVYILGALSTLHRLQGASRTEQFKTVMRSLEHNVPVYARCSCQYWTNEIDHGRLDVEQLLANSEESINFLDRLTSYEISAAVSNEPKNRSDGQSLVTENSLGPIFDAALEKIQNGGIQWSQKLFAGILLHMPIAKVNPVFEEYLDYLDEMARNDSLPNWASAKFNGTVRYDYQEIVRTTLGNMINGRSMPLHVKQCLRFVLMHLKVVPKTSANEDYAEMQEIRTAEIDLQKLFSIIQDDADFPDMILLKDQVLRYVGSNTAVIGERLRGMQRYQYESPFDLLIAALTRIQRCQCDSDVQDAIFALLSNLVLKKNLDSLTFTVPDEVDISLLLFYLKGSLVNKMQLSVNKDVDVILSGKWTPLAGIQSLIPWKKKALCPWPTECLAYAFTEALRLVKYDQIQLPKKVRKAIKVVVKSLVYKNPKCITIIDKDYEHSGDYPANEVTDLYTDYDITDDSSNEQELIEFTIPPGIIDIFHNYHDADDDDSDEGNDDDGDDGDDYGDYEMGIFDEYLDYTDSESSEPKEPRSPHKHGNTEKSSTSLSPSKPTAKPAPTRKPTISSPITERPSIRPTLSASTPTSSKRTVTPDNEMMLKSSTTERSTIKHDFEFPLDGIATHRPPQPFPTNKPRSTQTYYTTTTMTLTTTEPVADAKTNNPPTPMTHPPDDLEPSRAPSESATPTTTRIVNTGTPISTSTAGSIEKYDHKPKTNLPDYDHDANENINVNVVYNHHSRPRSTSAPFPNLTLVSKPTNGAVHESDSTLSTTTIAAATMIMTPTSPATRTKFQYDATEPTTTAVANDEPVLPPNLHCNRPLYVIFPKDGAPPYVAPAKSEDDDSLKFPPIQNMFEEFETSTPFDESELPDVAEVLEPIKQACGVNFVQVLLGAKIVKSEWPTKMSLLMVVLRKAMVFPKIRVNVRLTTVIARYIDAVDYICTAALFPVVVDSRDLKSTVLYVTFDIAVPQKYSLAASRPDDIPRGYVSLSLFHPKLWLQQIDSENPLCSLLPHSLDSQENPIPAMLCNGTFQDALGDGFNPFLYSSRGNLMIAVLKILSESPATNYPQPAVSFMLAAYLTAIRSVALYTPVPSGYFVQVVQFQQNTHANWQPDTTSLILALPPARTEAELQELNVILAFLQTPNLLPDLNISLPAYSTTRAALLKTIFQAAVSASATASKTSKLHLDSRMVDILRRYESKITTTGIGASPIIWVWVRLFVITEEVPLGDIIESVIDYDSLSRDMKITYNELMTYLSKNTGLLQGSNEFPFEKYRTKGSFLKALFEYLSRKPEISAPAEQTISKIIPHIKLTGSGAEKMNTITIDDLTDVGLQNSKIAALSAGTLNREFNDAKK